MQIHRSSRYAYFVLSTLVRKYKVALALGLVVGIGGSIALFRVWPRVAVFVFRPSQHIAIVGEFTPSNLPLSIQKKISRGLTDIGPDGSAIPSLATRWHVENDGRTYVFTLDTKALWHTGKTLVASDVNYNIRDVAFATVDDATLKATLEEPFSPFLTLVSKPIFQRGLRGVGEYKVAGIRLLGEAVQYLRLTPTGNIDLANLEYRFYRTEAQAILAYKLGNVDTIEDLTDASELTTWAHTTLVPHTKNNRIVAVYFNVKNQRLSDKTVRQALAYAIPDLGRPRVQSPLSQSSWAYSDRVRSYTFDMARAKRLLSDTGSGELTISTFSPYLETAQKISEGWTALGFTVNVKVENALPSDYQILVSAQDVPPDPDQYPFWHQTQAQTNITGYASVKIDKLLEDGRREIDPEKRKVIYEDFQRYLTEDAPAVFLYHPTLYTVRRSQ